MLGRIWTEAKARPKKTASEIFKKPNVKSFKVKFPKLDEARVREILVERHNFSSERVEKQFEKLHELKKKSAQQRLF